MRQAAGTAMEGREREKDIEWAFGNHAERAGLRGSAQPLRR
jgi:hypothetical protein